MREDGDLGRFVFPLSLVAAADNVLHAVIVWTKLKDFTADLPSRSCFVKSEVTFLRGPDVQPPRSPYHIASSPFFSLLAEAWAVF